MLLGNEDLHGRRILRRQILAWEEYGEKACVPLSVSCNEEEDGLHSRGLRQKLFLRKSSKKLDKEIVRLLEIKIPIMYILCEKYEKFRLSVIL